VVVELGEAKILVGKVAQLFEGGFDAQRAAGDGLEEGFQLLVDGRPPRRFVDGL